MSKKIWFNIHFTLHFRLMFSTECSLFLSALKFGSRIHIICVYNVYKLWYKILYVKMNNRKCILQFVCEMWWNTLLDITQELSWIIESALFDWSFDKIPMKNSLGHSIFFLILTIIGNNVNVLSSWRKSSHLNTWKIFAFMFIWQISHFCQFRNRTSCIWISLKRKLNQ